MNSIANTIRARAEADHASYPQYAGHWNGWVLVEVTKVIKTKMGQAFRKGEMSIAKRETEGELAGTWTVYSISNRCDTAVNAKNVRTV
jgi:hypothetical protein